MKEENLDFRSLSKIIFKRLPLIILIVIIGLLVGGFITYKSDVLYESKATLYVKPSSLGNTGVDYDDILSSQRLVKTYVEILKSRTIYEKTMELLESNLNYETFSNMITITSVRDTELISINTLDKNAENAQNITNKVITVFLAEIKETMGIENVFVIDEASINKNAVSPNVILNIAISSVVSLIVGLFLSFILESIDTKIKTHEDIKKYLPYDIKNIGLIPHDTFDASKNKITGFTTNIKIINEPHSLVSESLRMLRTSLNYVDLKVINVTSSLPGEGKSNIISNLAVAFASTGKKVLLIDCDIRKPNIYKIFNINRREGLTDLIAKKNIVDYKDVIQEYRLNLKYKVDIIASGTQATSPAELLNTIKFKNILDMLKEEYDLILLDTPPTSAVTDAVIVSKLSDGTLYVVESNRIEYKVLNNCLEQLFNSGVNVVGTVINKVNLKKEKNLYGHKYGYYYDS